ncbi:MAG: hypothetical protein JST39_16110 [Bacteroidetes bacterium]|nr:hypothetical protein [Bacteroidota bacterium]
MQANRYPPKLLFRIRALIVFFVVALILSGITAFPIETELTSLMQHRRQMPDWLSSFLTTAYEGTRYVNTHYPMLSYGNDWLAFAHIVIGMAFIGPLRDPVRNIWVVEWAMLACVAVIPLALIMRPIRSIPFQWTLLDCSFGVFGIIPLWILRSWIKKLDAAANPA